ncbi:DUF2975 domain-containing protein [Tepidicaulis sp. LMO-SS28]|uniref:DUF2975 domain-containing protein n=1 Tax=Tepidicaulis sp. LMO-SS28 TaxID=3447455 RepID=UPI003EE3C105
MTHDLSKRIARLSAATKHAATALIILLPLGLAAFWLVLAEPDPARFGPSFAHGPDNWSERAVGFGISLLPAAVALYALLHLRRLFVFYEQGFYFTAATVDCLRRLAWASIAAVPAGILAGSALSAALSLDNPPGARELSIAISSGQILALFAGVVLLIISWVMRDAVRLQEENAAFV